MCYQTLVLELLKCLGLAAPDCVCLRISAFIVRVRGNDETSLSSPYKNDVIMLENVKRRG